MNGSPLYRIDLITRLMPNEGYHWVGTSWYEEQKLAQKCRYLDIKRCGNERPAVSLSWYKFNRNVKETEHCYLNIKKAKNRKQCLNWVHCTIYPLSNWVYSGNLASQGILFIQKSISFQTNFKALLLHSQLNSHDWHYLQESLSHWSIEYSSEANHLKSFFFYLECYKN